MAKTNPPKHAKSFAMSGSKASHNKSEKVVGVVALDRADTLGDRAYTSLRTAIRRGLLAPGQQISTRRIAAELGISLTPAREALKRLLAERALEHGANRTVLVPILTRSRYAELMQIRIRLELLAAEAACPIINRKQLATLRSLYERHVLAHSEGRVKDVLRANEEFHFLIYSTAGMPALMQIIENLWLQVGPSLNLLYPAYREDWRGGRHHQNMIAAIQSSDTGALLTALEQDLADGRHLLEPALPP
jgi:DNA-binding GntR family transcriptional regulator